MPDQTNAFPRKHFFLEIFTRDISLEDCVLDLIDNSIDALVKMKNIDILSIVFKKREAKPADSALPSVDVDFSENQFKITDNCGGIADSGRTTRTAFATACSFKNGLKKDKNAL